MPLFWSQHKAEAPEVNGADTAVTAVIADVPDTVAQTPAEPDPALKILKEKEVQLETLGI